MAYENEFNDGGEAHEQGYPRSFNPHIWHTCAWYAWDAGWAAAEALDRQSGAQ